MEIVGFYVCTYAMYGIGWHGTMFVCVCVSNWINHREAGEPVVVRTVRTSGRWTWKRDTHTHIHTDVHRACLANLERTMIDPLERM